MPHPSHAIARGAMALSLLFPATALAADGDLNALREALRDLKTDYARRIEALERRISAAESAANRLPMPPSPVPLPVTEAPMAQTLPAAAASGFNPEISLILQGRIKSLRAVPERTLTGYWPATHDHDTEKRGLSVDHTELAFAANIDPLFRGTARFAVVDDAIAVEEAHFSTPGLGGGLGLKGGRFRAATGYINGQHPHEWDFADAPLMQKALFGAEGYRQDGLQLTWLAPSETYLQFGAEIGRGDAFPGTERNGAGAGAGAVFARLGGDIGLTQAWQAGVSYLATRAAQRPAEINDTDMTGPNAVSARFSGRSRVWIGDFVWKWAPGGDARERNFKLQGEYFRRSEDGQIDCTTEIATSPCVGTLALGDYQSRQSGGYLQGVWQFAPRWRIGARYDWLSPGIRHYDAPAVFAALDANSPPFAAGRPKRTSLMFDWSPSEFSRLRLQYARDTAMAAITDNQVTLQYIMSLGAHGAHKF